MSYLQLPRLHFAGKFQADPSTVNNNPGNFDANQFQGDYRQLKGVGGDTWNPRGTGSFRFKDCIIHSVVYVDGTVVTDPKADPVIGLPIVNADAKVAGKIVDLDTQQQMVSELWGLQVGLRGATERFMGDFETAAFADIWLRLPGQPTNANFAAFYQSIIRITDWTITGRSRFLKELASKYASGTPDKLSIKFNVDGHNSDNTSAEFTFGRVTGTIGAYAPDEPVHFMPCRQLATQQANPFLNTAYAVVDQHMVHLDLGNSIPTSAAGGPFTKESAAFTSL